MDDGKSDDGMSKAEDGWDDALADQVGWVRDLLRREFDWPSEGGLGSHQLFFLCTLLLFLALRYAWGVLHACPSELDSSSLALRRCRRGRKS